MSRFLVEISMNGICTACQIFGVEMQNLKDYILIILDILEIITFLHKMRLFI